MENSPWFSFDLTVFTVSSLSVLGPSDFGPAVSPVSSQSVSESSDSEPDIAESEVAPHLRVVLASGRRWWPVPRNVG